jgi:hypothetical protein
MRNWSSFEQRFESYIRRAEGDACWLWAGPRQKAGYGEINRGNKVLLAHRVSYEKFVGPIPDGMNLLHTCDNPPCIRPDHLVPGTQGDNMRDAKRKGRLRSGRTPGESHPSAKLTNDAVRAIRSEQRRCDESENAFYVRLANRFGASRTTVRAVRLGRVWRHVA